jgi:hypothetical protein
MRRVDQVLDIRDVSESNLRAAVGSLDGYAKFTSMVWIRALRQPLLDGLIVKRWSPEADEALKELCRRQRRDEALLRIDKLNERWSKRRGGYLVPVSKARAVIRELNKEGRIAAFLEPLSPYCDRYCLAAITDEAQEKMIVEIVGPGFDASDLLRSDTQPHERFEVSVPLFSHQKPAAIFAHRKYVMRSEDYRRTAGERLVKIGARLRNPAYPEVVLASPGAQSDQLSQDAVGFLNRTNQTLLLKHLDAYEPIPRRLLERFAVGVGGIIDGLRRYHIHLGSTAFSGTFTTRGRLVFWDFFPANLARAKMLYLSS